MSYTPPAVTAAGLTVPKYADILADNVAQFQAIYGQSTYVGIDSAIYQLISVFSAKTADAMQAVQLDYNNRSPLTAVGAALDSLVKLNGLVRNAASPSTCVVTITGTANAVIPKGVIRDSNGILWDLPANTTIGNSGIATSTAVCETPGPIAAEPSTLTGIANPSSGWMSVTNATGAVLGLAVETDSQLRARQAISVALPSLTTLASTVSAISATAGVTRYNLFENPTGATDSYGTPAHSLTAVVEGGTDLAVATAIYGKHGIGCLTNGTTSVPVTDPFTSTTFTVNFYRPTYVAIFVNMSVHALSGFNSSLLTQIQTAVAAYLNSLQIGESVTLSALYAVAQSVIQNLSQPTFSIRALTIGTSSGSTSTADIAMTFNQVAQGSAVNVVITQV